MSDLLTDLELAGAREDLNATLGIDPVGDYTNSGTTVRITNPSNSEPVLNLTTGALTPAAGTQVYEGGFFIAPVIFKRDRIEIVAGQITPIKTYRGLGPYDLGDVHFGAQVEVLTSRDPNMVGRVLDVTDVILESEIVGRRFTLVDNTIDGEGENC